MISKSLMNGRMTSISDTLTVGLVLVLLFGSIALYLYTRIQQAEQKISLLESILLDMKMSSEIKSYTELPAYENKEEISTEKDKQYTSFDDANEISDIIEHSEIRQSRTPSISSKDDTEESDVEQYKSVLAEAINDNDVEPQASKVSVNYESMTIKELHTLAKSRGITGAGSMKKGAVIEALNTSDRSLEPGQNVSSSSFLDTSSTFQPSTESH
jgi:hypothetical protein